jgi:four helix bundle protein
MDYRDLVVWQRAMDLAVRVYEASSNFPRDERYGLTSQVRKAAVSIPSNIAEGQGRRTSDGEFVRFLMIAMGSLCELETQLELAVRLKMVDSEKTIAVRTLSEEVGRLLNGLVRSKKA